MKYKFGVDRKSVEIEVPSNATFHSPTHVQVNGRRVEIWIGEQVGDEIRSIFCENRLYQVEVARNEAGYPEGIYVNDEFHPAELIKIDNLFYYRERPRSASRSGHVRSFIPGNIRKIFFSVGDRVKEGDIILIHEAMKMENEIRAPRSGIVKHIGVKEGENILANHLLFEIE